MATAERKLKLVNDSQMKDFTTRTVECKECNSTVELDGEFDYDLTKWEEHKSTCPTYARSASSRGAPNLVLSRDTDSPMHEAEIAAPVASASTPRPPPSTASTEATAVASESSPSRKGQKRSRNDDAEDSESDQRSVRPRKASYDPPTGDGPGFLTRLIAPFKSFVNGFRQGMSQG